MAVDWQLLSHVDPEELDEIQADDVSQHLLEVNVINLIRHFIKNKFTSLTICFFKTMINVSFYFLYLT